MQRLENILIVDDKQDFRESLTDLVRDLGYFTLPSASSGAAGIASVRERRPDLALMDVNMPGEIDGIDAADVIQRLFHVPVVLLTGRSDDEAVGKALDKRVFGYVVKPVVQQVLSTAIEIAYFNFLMDSERSSEITIGIHTDRRLIYLSRSAERLTGHTSKALEGFPLEHIIAPPSRDTVEFMISQSSDSKAQSEVEVIPADVGGRVWLELSCRAVKTKEGSSGRLEGYQLTGHDITSQHAIAQRLRVALLSKGILLQEVHHRFRNQLQGVSGLLKREAARLSKKDDSGEIAEVFRSAQGRLNAMQALHEELYQSNDQIKVDMRSYIGRLIHNVRETYGVDSTVVRIVKEVAAVTLNVDTASPCGLIINELLTNSVKHGFPDGRCGTIVINMSANILGEITLKVCDDGVGFEMTDERAIPETQGTRLIKNLSSQLHGIPTLSGQGGLHFELTFTELRFKQRQFVENDDTRS
jgi:PAS domain S-box-containing protein